MKVFEINGTLRGTGKSQTKKVRNAGDVPCVLYGSGDPIHFAVKKIEIKKAVYTPDVFVVNLNLDGKVHKAIIRDSQFHKVHDEITHLDFLRVQEEGTVEASLPVKLTGVAEGTLIGGRLQQMARRLKVRGILDQLPERVEVDITSVGLGKTIRVMDVTFKGYTVTSSGATPIAMVDVPRSAKTAAAETTAAAPAGGKAAAAAPAAKAAPAKK